MECHRMTSSHGNPRIRDLASLLEGLRALYEQLSELTTARMTALRKADLAALGECEEKQGSLTRRIEERLGLRRQMMERLGPELGVGARDARAMSLSNLLARVPHEERGRLANIADALRKAVFNVAQANRRLGAASRELLHHVQWVLSSVRPKDESPDAYSRSGTRQTAGGACLVEATA